MKEKRICLRGAAAVFSLLLLVLFTAVPAAATTWVVQPGESIQAAIDNASAGDIVRVHAGTYAEALTIDKSLTLEGIGNPVIEHATDSSSQQMLSGAVEISGADSVFRGFTINYTKEYCFGIYITANDVLVENNTLTHCNEGIWINGVQNTTVRKNVIKDCWGWTGLYDGPGSSSNWIYLNDFIGDSGSNTQIGGSSKFYSPEEMTYSYGGVQQTGYLGNYYDTYTGTDADGNGVGETPEGNDAYPLMTPSTNYLGEQPTGPIVDFTADVTSGDFPLTVRFTDMSTGADEWSWDFENDGAVDSTEQNPTHTYDTPGIYTVNLTATNSSGSNSEVKTDYITVTGEITPVADFTANVTSGTAPLTVRFIDASTNAPSSWSWDFGDGTNSTEQDPTHTYDTAGIYTVSLTVSNSAGNDSLVKPDLISISGTYYVGASGGGNFTTIQAAIDAAPAGSTLIIRNGTYVENIVVNKALTITSENGPAATILQPAQADDDTVAVTAPGVVIAGLTLSKTGKKETGISCTADGCTLRDNIVSGHSNGIRLQGANDTVVTGNTCTGNTYGMMLDTAGNTTLSENICNDSTTYGIMVQVSPSCILLDNIVADSGKRGIWIDYSNDNQIVNNTVNRTGGEGIKVQGGTGNTLINNTANENENGYYIQRASNTTLLNNTAENNTNGIWAYGDDTDWSDNCLISGNTLKNNTGYGVYVCARNSTYEKNTVSGSTSGIYLSRTTANDTIRKNTVSGNEQGMTIEWSGSAGPGTGHQVYLNAFAGNQENIANSENNTCTATISWNTTESKEYVYNGTTYVGYLGNYYSDYTGNDTEGVGVGDTPYALPGGLGNDTVPLVSTPDRYTVVGRAPATPNADFTATPTQGAVPLTVQFTDRSAGADEWAWDFGDGNTSTEQNPTHTYDTPGAYTVNLTASRSRTIANLPDSDTVTKENYVYALFEAPDIEWNHALGGTSSDYAYAINQTTDRGYIVAGDTQSTDGDVSGNHGSYDAWVVKLDADGNLLWQKCLGGSRYDKAYAVRQCSDGGYIVAGYTSSSDGDVSGHHGSESDYSYDAWVVKLDTDGNLTWQKCLGGSEKDYAYSVDQAVDGGYIVAGYTKSTDGDVSGNHGSEDAWVVKLDADGNLLWQKCLGGSSYDEAFAVRHCSDDGCIVAGYTGSNDDDVSGNHGSCDAWVAKLDADGNLLWQKCLGGSSLDEAYAVQQCSDGGYIVAGTAYSFNGDVTGNHGGTGDVWVVKLDADGNLIWQKCFGGTDEDWAYAIDCTADGGYAVSGVTRSTNGDVTGNNGYDDAWVVKLDADGNLIWQKCLGGSHVECGEGITSTADGGIAIASPTNSNNGDVTGNHGNYDAWVVKLKGDNSALKPVSFSFSPATAETGVNGTTEVSIVANKLPAGLAGYNLTVTLGDPSVATITAVDVPDWASLNATGDLPAGAVFIQAADLNDAISAGAENVTLATLTLTGLSAGSANITAAVTRMDGDDGSVIEANVVDGRVFVSAAAAVPGCENCPHDLDGNGICEDVNGNGLFDFDDIVTFFNAIEWAAANEPVEILDVNGNGRIDFADLVGLYQEI